MSEEERRPKESDLANSKRMPKRDREDVGKVNNDRKAVKTERVDNPTPEKVEVVKTSKLETDSGIESPTQKENAGPANASVAKSTDDIKPIEDEKPEISLSSETKNISVSETGDHTEANSGTEKKPEEKQEPLAEDSDNHRRASNDPREVKKSRRQKELGIND